MCCAFTSNTGTARQRCSAPAAVRARGLYAACVTAHSPRQSARFNEIVSEGSKRRVSFRPIPLAWATTHAVILSLRTSKAQQHGWTISTGPPFRTARRWRFRKGENLLRVLAALPEGTIRCASRRPAILVCRRWERRGETASVADAAAVRYEISGPVSPFVVIAGLWPGGICGCLPGGRRERWRKLQPSLPKGNRHMRPTLNQSANAAAKAKGTIFGMIYRRMVPRLGHKQTGGAIAHRQCRLIWLIL